MRKTVVVLLALSTLALTGCRDRIEAQLFKSPERRIQFVGMEGSCKLGSVVYEVPSSNGHMVTKCSSLISVASVLNVADQRAANIIDDITRSGISASPQDLDREIADYASRTYTAMETVHQTYFMLANRVLESEQWNYNKKKMNDVLVDLSVVKARVRLTPEEERILSDLSYSMVSDELSGLITKGGRVLGYVSATDLGFTQPVVLKNVELFQIGHIRYSIKGSIQAPLLAWRGGLDYHYNSIVKRAIKNRDIKVLDELADHVTILNTVASWYTPFDKK